MTNDEQTMYPRFLFAKLIRQEQAAVAASCAAMERSGDVLEMTFLRKDFAPLTVLTVIPQHCINLTNFTMDRRTIQKTALIYYYKFILHPYAQLLGQPKKYAEKKTAEIVFVSEQTIQRWKTDFKSSGNHKYIHK